MNLFQSVKQSVTARQAASFYGLSVSDSGMVCCPFHNDRTPSMKVGERYYCFGCQAHGDVIDLTANLFHLTLKEAALKLAADFSIRIPDEPYRPSDVPCRPRPPDMKQLIRESGWKLLHYYGLLRTWREVYAPRREDTAWHPLFCEALDNMALTEYILDGILSNDEAERREFYEAYHTLIDELDESHRSEQPEKEAAAS